jgi:pimeloyl-[acyl-carrier protein] synthase
VSVSEVRLGSPGNSEASVAARSPEADGRYELLAPSALDDPYPVYDEMRATAPVYRDRRFLGWILTRYDDVAAVLKDNSVSSRRPTASEPVGRSLASIADEVRELREFQSRWMMYLDPPEHTRLRSLVSNTFTVATVANMRDRIQGLIDKLLAPGREAGAFDVVQDLARPLPALVIADLIGLPREDRKVFQYWSDGLAAGMVLSTRGQDALDGLMEAQRCQRELIAYFQALIASRRVQPRDDLLTQLIASEEDGNFLNDDELIAMCMLLLFGGHETTTHLIGNSVLALLQNPSEFERLRAEPALIGRAVEEFLRFDCPVQATGRRATADMEIGDCHVKAGEFLTPVIGAANRDPSRFEDPNRLDIGRQENRHLAFAHGAHFCLGAPLARLEGQLAIRSIVGVFRSLESGGSPVRRRHFYLRGLESLPVSGRAA